MKKQQDLRGQYKTNIVQKVYGQLVLLGFAITDFTPVAYQRHRL